MVIAVYPGTFDPLTRGHEDLVRRAAGLFTKLVVGVADSLKGQVPVGFLVLKAGVEPARDTQIVRETVTMIRERIGPVAAFKTALVVKRLPKTRSGKILRGTIQRIADCQEYKPPATIDDPATLGEIEEALRSAGYATQKNG